MSVLGIDQITYAADDLRTCRRFFSDWGLALKSETADQLVFECLNGCRVVVAALGTPGLPPAVEEWRSRVAQRPAVRDAAVAREPVPTMGPEPGRWG